MSEYSKCTCVHCSQSIEFPVELSGQEVKCPSCDQPLIMPDVAPTPSGFFGSVIDKYKNFQQGRRDIADFKKDLFDAVSDGVLTDSEIELLLCKMQEFGLSEVEIKKHCTELYESAFGGASKFGHLCSEKEQQLYKIRSFLGIQTYTSTDAKIRRSRTIFDIQHGVLAPLADIPNVVLAAGEVAYWLEPSTLLEHRVVKSGYSGGSAGMSFRVAKGLSLRIGQHKGQFESTSEAVPISSGRFIVTSSRLLFSGDCKSFAIPLNKILDVNIFKEGIMIGESTRQKKRIVQFENKNGDIICELLNALIDK